MAPRENRRQRQFVRSLKRTNYLSSTANWKIGSPIEAGKPLIGQNDHFLFEAIDNMLEGVAMVEIGRVTVQLVQ